MEKRFIRQIHLAAVRLVTFQTMGLIILMSAVTLICESRVEADSSQIPVVVQTVLDHTTPLTHPRGSRLPMYILPISGALSGVSDQAAERVLADLASRGIGYSVEWNPTRLHESLTEAVRIAKLQQKIGQPVAANATACLQGFCDGSSDTLHIGLNGERFSDDSCGAPLGCPFALQHRIGDVRKRIEQFLDGYQSAGVSPAFVFADWEIDGPIEWNGHRESCARCVTCRSHIPDFSDFRAFQASLRRIRCQLQREAFSEPVRKRFPESLVGNYGVNPHDGHRYWYDYFETPVDDSIPVLKDQKASYREWYPEFPETGFTFAMPVIYTWYRTFAWYDFPNTDYRWFYNMLKEASSAGRHTAPEIPIIPFVHRNTTAPPEKPDAAVVAMSHSAYQDLLWHMLMRGHDTFFVWCLPEELGDETRTVHEVYSNSLQYAEFLSDGTPEVFDVPSQPGIIESRVRLGDQVLVRRSLYRDQVTEKTDATGPEFVTAEIVQANSGSAVQSKDSAVDTVVHSSSNMRPAAEKAPLLIQRGSQKLFPIGIYELPSSQADLELMEKSGINLIRCGSRADLDRVHSAGLLGWVPVSVQQGPTEALRQQVLSLADHPALAVWEGPDEIIWTFTAYSSLQKTVGVTKEDWYEQRPNALRYAESQAATILPNMRLAIDLIRSVDPKKRPFWMNEAADSDLRYTRGYVSAVDSLGCDYYPVRGTEPFDLRSVSQMVERWKQVGKGKPVWMVLQAFSWHTMVPRRGLRYPHFPETRYMALSSIAHGAQAILYWGSTEIQDPKFRESLYAMTSELAALQPFLTQPVLRDVRAEVVRDLFEPPGNGVTVDARQNGDDLLMILINEDNHRHLGVDVQGLDQFCGRRVYELYGTDETTVDEGGFTVRMKPLEARVYSTSRRFETTARSGRDYSSPAEK